ncbi:contactin-5-like [Ylistrum balloti]|uniref:contactin-5-like n=1 Tax=Ylistrum balloti TaxID=509963 RepID=UPI002905D4E3|nr:contactin-5-like [Ylistrum balloti]
MMLCLLVFFFFQLQYTSSMEGTNKTAVFGLPSIVTRYKDTYYVRPYNGSSFNLTCEATGNPTPMITWIKNEHPFLDSKKANVTSSGTLVLTNPDSSTKGTYQCKATNRNGASFSRQITIAIAVLGAFQTLRRKTVSEDQYQHIALPCTDRPTCLPSSECTLIWTNGKGDVIPTERRIFVDSEGTLHFLYLTLSEDQKNFTCGVRNGLLYLHTHGQPTRLSVRSHPGSQRSYPPALVFNKSVTGKIAESSRLQCVFSGYPLPDIDWLDVNGDSIEESDVYSFQDNKQTLIISYLTNKHEGFYTCQGQQQTGAHDVGKVYLNITGPPIFETGAMMDQVLTSGLDARFNCLSRSLPNEINPELPVWYQNGQEIEVYGPDEKFYTNGTTLIVQSLDKNDTSSIQCMVQNSVGRSFREAKLIVIDPITVIEDLPNIVEISPNAPVSAFVAAITDTRMSLKYQWSVLDNGNWTSLPPGVVVSDDQQEVTFSPDQSNIYDMVGVYRVVIQHHFDLIILKTNVIASVPTTTSTTATPETKTSTTEELTTTTIATDFITMNESSVYNSTVGITPGKPPSHSQEEKASSFGATVAILVIGIVTIIVLITIVAVIYHRRRIRGKLVLNKPAKYQKKTGGEKVGENLDLKTKGLSSPSS